MANLAEDAKKLSHRGRHQLLHSHLDELIADWIVHTKKFPSKSTVFELMEWSSRQAKKPDHKMENS